MDPDHSIKSSCVQLYCSLHIHDKQIMEIIIMKGHNAYCNYTAVYKDFASTDFPRYSSVDWLYITSRVALLGIQNLWRHGRVQKRFGGTWSRFVEIFKV